MSHTVAGVTHCRLLTPLRGVAKALASSAAEHGSIGAELLNLLKVKFYFNVQMTFYNKMNHIQFLFYFNKVLYVICCKNCIFDLV